MRILTAILVSLAVASPASAQVRPGSIYQVGAGPISPISAKTARRVGDILTIVIEENQNIINDEKADLKKGSDLGYQLLDFNIKPNTFQTLPSLSGSTTNDFAGTAKYEKKGTFTARLAAVVMDTLPNGNLVVQGRREIRIDKELKVIEFSGVVRAWDIQPDNTIESELVADARVSYQGTGPLTRSTNQRGLGAWIRNAIDWIWPF